MEWQPIETAPKDGDSILLTCIMDGVQYWTAQASWQTACPGYARCASYSGWFAELPALCDPVKGRNIYTSPTATCGDVIQEKAYPPTHWAPLLLTAPRTEP